MVRTGYHIGRSQEYRAMGLLRREGWMVLRSAGSHSPVDLLAGKDAERLIVQVKSGGGRINDQELKELIRWAKTSNSDAEVWRFRGRGGPDRQSVYRAERAATAISSVKPVNRKSSSQRGK